MLRFLPSITLSFLCCWLPVPAAMAVGAALFGLHLAAFAHAQNWLPDEAMLETLRARFGAYLWVLFASIGLTLLLLGPPIAWMVSAAHVFAPLAVALGALLLLAVCLRLWSLPGLLFVWPDARQGSGESVFTVLRRTTRLAWILGARAADALQLGLPLVVVLVFVFSFPSLLGVVVDVAGGRLLVAGIYSIVVCPLAAWLLLRLVSQALFEPAAVVAKTIVDAEPMSVADQNDAISEPEAAPIEPVLDALESVPTLSASVALLPESEREVAAPQEPEPAPVVSVPNLLELLDDPAALTRALALKLNTPAELCAAAHHAAAHDQLESLPALLNAGWDPSQNAADGESLIERAIRSASGATIKSLLTSVLVNKSLDEGREPALLAALASKRHDLPNIVRLLVKSGADPRRAGRDGLTAVAWAVKREMNELMPFLLRNTAAPARPVLTTVVAAQDLDLIGMAQRGDVNKLSDALKNVTPAQLQSVEGVTALIHAAGRGHRTVLELLLNAGATATAMLPNGSSALSAAALAGHADVVGLLLRSGCTVDGPLAGGATALLLAASRWRYATVSNLLRAGADPQRMSDGDYTALSAAAAFVHQARSNAGGRETLQALLKAGANVSHANADGQTAAMLLTGAGLKAGSAAGDESVCELLRLVLSAGAGVNQVDAIGRTAVHWCALHGLVGAAALLIKARAQVRVADAQGYQPIDLAHQAGQTEFVAWLVQQGADH